MTISDGRRCDAKISYYDYSSPRDPPNLLADASFKIVISQGCKESLRNRDPMFYCVKPNLQRIYDVAPLPQQQCSFQALAHLLSIR